MYSSKQCKAGNIEIPLMIYKKAVVLFSNSTEIKTFPNIFKLARVTPVYKSGDSGELNYRPISTLPLSKNKRHTLLYKLITKQSP